MSSMTFRDILHCAFASVRILSLVNSSGNKSNGGIGLSSDALISVAAIAREASDECFKIEDTVNPMLFWRAIETRRIAARESPPSLMKLSLALISSASLERVSAQAVTRNFSTVVEGGTYVWALAAKKDRIWSMESCETIARSRFRSTFPDVDRGRLFNGR